MPDQPPRTVREGRPDFALVMRGAAAPRACAMRWLTRNVGWVPIFSAKTARARSAPVTEVPNACSKHELSALQRQLRVVGWNPRRRQGSMSRLRCVAGYRFDLIVRQHAAESGIRGRRLPA